MKPSVAAVALALSAASCTVLAVTPPPVLVPPSPAPPAQASAPNIDGSFPVTLTLNGTLTGIHPDAVKGAWLCSARALSKPAIDAEMKKISALRGPAARSEYGAFLEYRAHYLGQQATVEFAISGGASAATRPISIKVSRDDLVDQTTKRLIDQPAVMIGCWLRLANAAGQSGFAYQVAKRAARAQSLDAMLQLTTPPYVLAGASVPNE